MKIYLSHSKNSDYQKELYEPIKRSSLTTKHQFIFPHDEGQKIDSKELFHNKMCDLVVAEVSTPATGQGIELGFANIYNIPIICFYKSGARISNSLKAITDKIIEYKNADNLVAELNDELNK